MIKNEPKVEVVSQVPLGLIKGRVVVAHFE